MKRGFKIAILFFLWLFTTVHGFSQEGFLPGYVITNKGDTLKGKIKDRKFINGTSSWQKISFIDSVGEKYKFDPEEIKEYGRKGRTKYRTLVIGVESKKTFLEVSEEGPVILYSYYRGTWGAGGNAITLRANKNESKERLAFFVGIQGVPVYLNDSKERVECFLQFKNKPNSLMQWRPGDYKRTAKIFFNDSPEMIKLLEDDILDENDIYSIVKKYNANK